MTLRRLVSATLATALVGGACASSSAATVCEPIDDRSVARVWNEAALDAIRRDTPAPTVHARNLFHLSLAMWDAATEVGTDARADAVSGAAHRVLTARYRNAEGRTESLAQFDETVVALCGSDPDTEAWRQGVVVAEALLADVLNDGSNERLGYEDPTYRSVNPALVVAESGTEMVDPNRWQPLLIDAPIAQNGLPLPGGEQDFIGSNWGQVTPFAIGPNWRDSLDPGPPPLLGTTSDDDFREALLVVVEASAALDEGVATIDLSPSATGVRPLGYESYPGHAVDPASGEPYAANVADLADYGRAIAEYWADGPDSETPPGHWNVIANDVGDLLDPDDLRIGGDGPVLDRLAWDLGTYLALNGAMHDAAIVAWGLKADYDYVRPISMIRHAAGLGQSSDPDGAAYHPDGIRLRAGLVEVVTAESVAAGERHEGLEGGVGEIAVRSWRGSPDDPTDEIAGVGWILGVDWVPYQRPSFVTPAFAAYVSGHSTFSRAGATVLEGLTGSAFFPTGPAEHVIEAGSLRHEDGPSETVTLQWATYADAADEAGRSRLYGGIHVPVDDVVGRELGAAVGAAAMREVLPVIEQGP